jgi:transglutaminase-like putative cysteine protease
VSGSCYAFVVAILLLGVRCASGQERASPTQDGLDDVPAVLRAMVVPSPYRISRAARRATIEYRVQIDGMPDWFWPDTGEQRIRPARGATLLTICADCGREAPPSREQLQRALQPTPWLPSDDSVLVARARWARGVDARRRMQALVGVVRRRLDGPIRYDGYLDARTAFDARGGDCTEFALLLATLGRARGIPTRVVAGVAYGSRFVGARHAFGPHLWVQAWTGERWESFDAGGFRRGQRRDRAIEDRRHGATRIDRAAVLAAALNAIRRLRPARCAAPAGRVASDRVRSIRRSRDH